MKQNSYLNQPVIVQFTKKYWSIYIITGYKYNELIARCGPHPPTISSTKTATVSSTAPQLTKTSSVVSLKESTAAVINNKTAHLTTKYILKTSNAISFDKDLID